MGALHLDKDWRTVTEFAYLKRNCPACGATSTKPEVQSQLAAELLPFSDLRSHWSGLFKEKVFFSYERCAACGLLYAPTYFTPDQLEILYADMAPNMELVTSTALEATQRGYWDATTRHADLTGDYLEIGPDIGYIAGHAAREGQFDHFWLFEPNRSVHQELSNAVRGHPHDISVLMDDLSMVKDDSVGLAVMVHVLDHVLDPVTTLQQVCRKLKPGGTLMIVTHNEKSLLRTFMAKRWPPFCLQHPEIYNPASMRRMVARAGYSSVKVQRSKNYFPISFIAKQAAFTFGFDIKGALLPEAAIGLKLGNIITFARR